MSANTEAKTLFLLKPRGFCAGVVRAIDIVRIALETFGPPSTCARRSFTTATWWRNCRPKVRFSSTMSDEVPPGERVIYSAHGVAPQVREASRERKLRVIDATCPLVTKVHVEAVRFARDGYSLILIGHLNHDEIIGTLGEAPQVTSVVNSVEQVKALKVPDPDRVAYLTQTTLSLDEARDIIVALKERFPNIKGPHAQDICYATENRQVAVKDVPASPTSCWLWVRRIARTRTGWSKWRGTWAPARI